MTTLTSTAPIVSPGHTKRRRASRGHVVDVVRTTAGIPGCVPPWLALRDRLGVTAPDSSPWRVGVVIEQEDDQVVVRRVLPGAPAQDMLYPGARLITVNGEQPETLEDWAAAIRGAPGTSVELEVAYPCGGHKVIGLTRNVIRLEY